MHACCVPILLEQAIEASVKANNSHVLYKTLSVVADDEMGVTNHGNKKYVFSGEGGRPRQRNGTRFDVGGVLATSASPNNSVNLGGRGLYDGRFNLGRFVTQSQKLTELVREESEVMKRWPNAFSISIDR